jgi:hypothetical protein
MNGIRLLGFKSFTEPFLIQQLSLPPPKDFPLPFPSGRSDFTGYTIRFIKCEKVFGIE